MNRILVSLLLVFSAPAVAMQAASTDEGPPAVGD